MARNFEFNGSFDEQVRDLVEHQVLRPWALRVQADAQRLAPVDTGALSGSIDVKVVAYDTALIGSDLPYAASVEFGSRPHIIRAGPGKVLHNRATGQTFGREVHHPGSRAQPYLRPALYRRWEGA